MRSFHSETCNIERNAHLLVRRLATLGLVEYCFRRSPGDADQVVIEPQNADYWPRTRPLNNADTLVLSRFAYMRRRGEAMVLNRPAPAPCSRFAIRRSRLRWPYYLHRDKSNLSAAMRPFQEIELLSLLMDCQVLFTTAPVTDRNLRACEGDDDLILWDFHDLLFHTRSTEGRHANPLGGLYPYAGVISPAPAVRPRWPGKKIDLGNFSAPHGHSISPFVKLLRERHSIRDFDDRHPITLAELSCFLRTPRASSPNGKAGRTSAMAVRWSPTPPGHTLQRAPPTNSSSIWL